MKTIALLVTALTLAVAAVADATPNVKIVQSAGTIHGHLAQPATGQGYTFAGLVSDSKLGDGATTSHGTLNGMTTSGTLIVYLDKGILRATFRFKVTPNSDGTVMFQGTTKYTGGTGIYKGANGSGQTTATQDAAGYTTFKYTQTLKVPKR